MTTVRRTPGPGAAILAKALKELQGVSGQVGWLESSVYKNGISVAYVASIQEYGYAPKNIAPRMGWRAAIPGFRAQWKLFAERGAKAIFKGSGTVRDMFEGVGGRAEGDLRKQIASIKEPLLAIPTLEARARYYGLEHWTELSATGQKPLVFTGYMLATVTHVVNVGGLTIA